MEKQENGEVHRARIVQMIEDHDSDINENPTMIKFRLSINNDTAEDVITYNKLLEYLSKDEENDIVWKFRQIVSHQGPLRPEHPDYKGSMYNIMVEWETGEITSEPLQVIAADDPVTCAIYAKDNNLLDLPGWKRFKSMAKRQKKFTRLINQAKLKSYSSSPKYKYGFEVPKNYTHATHAMHLDEKNKNTMWKDAADLEIQQILLNEISQDQVVHATQGYGDSDGFTMVTRRHRAKQMTKVGTRTTTKGQPTNLLSKQVKEYSKQVRKISKRVMGSSNQVK
jgi:hypothetical protein